MALFRASGAFPSQSGKTASSTSSIRTRQSGSIGFGPSFRVMIDQDWPGHWVAAVLSTLRVTLKNSTLEAVDGRCARSQRTRAAVAEAMLDCLEGGNLRPSAKQVAERAGVSTRAVFRHFDNMEALLREISELHLARVVKQLPPIVTEGPLDRRIDALVRHSARRNEIIAPVRRASLLSEPFSEVVRERHAWLRRAVRQQVCSAFAPELEALSDADRRDRIAALRALLSFGYWEELRRHERLSNAVAIRVLRDAVRAVLRP
jgi:AcrR family transcriptional regulator